MKKNGLGGYNQASCWVKKEEELTASAPNVIKHSSGFHRKQDLPTHILCLEC